jgi:hypothetical protein
MPKQILRNLLVALLLLVYVSQGVAAAHTACQRMTLQANIPESLEGNSESEHCKQQNEAAKDTSGGGNCCPHCDCYVGGIFTAALPVDQLTNAQPAFSKADDTYSRSPPGLILFSLFRPPIAS